MALDYDEALVNEELLPKRSKWESIKRGLRRKCPCCGEGKVYKSYLKIVDHCPSCKEELGHIRSDDMAPWATILILGHILGPIMVHVERNMAPPLWLSLSIFFPIIIVATLAILPTAKAACLGLMWSLRMKGDEQH